ncbi:vacuolar protein sorting-associated protein 32 homolog 1 isoform X2 [Aplysia californica]|uniref:Vacuolar protein sorting-associated protein 32 homolog 1 isoform X2 n=1 Tax=Aplysia californica TaxID=6500 RepID=A0ABM1VQC4_APLCA|nr:vacuolar protein sorting-associated protein 32 homolog 1 isoform X2 [Aplysia californica]
MYGLRLFRNMQHEVTDCVTTLAAFRGECLPLVPQDEDFNIVLQNLKKSGRVQIKDLEDGTVVVKLCKRGQSTAEPFKDTDIQIYRITVTQKKLEEEAELLSSRIDGFTEEARSYVQQGRKTLALYSLRKKKATQKVLDRKSACIMKLQDIVIKIEEARTNAMVITACETGVAALKSLEKDLNIDRVEAVMDEVGEALEDQEEISSAMEAAFPAHQRDLEEDLEQELQELLSGNRDEIVDISLPHDDSLSLKLSSLCVDDMDLPNVPTHSPSGSAASRKNSPSSVKTALYS